LLATRPAFGRGLKTTGRFVEVRLYVSEAGHRLDESMDHSREQMQLSRVDSDDEDRLMHQIRQEAAGKHKGKKGGEF
jgi:hypothetical protein